MLRSLLQGLVDIIYPKTCAACKAKLPDNRTNIDNIICRQCWDKIEKNLPPFCHCCGRHLEKNNIHKNICPVCARANLHFDRAFSSCKYSGVLKDLIHDFKYKGKDYLGESLAKLMAEHINEYNLPLAYLDFIVPIPLHKAKQREREFNQAEILSRHIAKQFGLELLRDTLLRSRNTSTQTELEPKQRFLNVRDSFFVKEKEAVKGKNLLIVDDVLTTGATASEASRTLKQAGANIVFVLTLAN